MSLWPGMMVNCNAFPEKWKWCGSILPTNTGDALASFLKNEDCQYIQEVTKGQGKSWRSLRKKGTARDNTPKQFAAGPNFFLRILNPIFWSCGINNMSGASTLSVLTLYLVAHASDNLVCLIYLNKQDFCWPSAKTKEEKNATPKKMSKTFENAILRRNNDKWQ